MNKKDDLMLWFNHNRFNDRQATKKHSDAILHQLLANACPESDSFEIKRTENGKPFTEASVWFSYSHSGRAYLYGLSQYGEIGLDIERTDKIRDFMTLSKRYFHADEYRHMQRLPRQDRPMFFYRLWTRKEAWCKLCGGVLWYYLGRSVLSHQPVIEDQQQVYLTDLTDIRGYAGAVATDYPIHQVYINTIK
jgi:phosphopantetheine--protein transferase-like protein